MDEEKEIADLSDPDLKIILLGDSAVGKSKLIERYLLDEYDHRQMSTYALTLYRKTITLDSSESLVIDFWDTAGQDVFSKMHPSYYYRAHACILVFDVTRKITYQHLSNWYEGMRKYCPSIPVILVANKVDMDYNVTKKEFKFASTYDLPLFFVSAADGCNVVKIFQSAIIEAKRFKESGGDLLSDVLDFLKTAKYQDDKGDTKAES
jgi:Rab-like protein 2